MITSTEKGQGKLKEDACKFHKKGTKTLWKGRSESYVRNPMTIKGKQSIFVLFHETFQSLLPVNNPSILLSFPTSFTGGVEREEDIFSKLQLIKLVTNSYLRQLCSQSGKNWIFLSLWIPTVEDDSTKIEVSQTLWVHGWLYRSMYITHTKQLTVLLWSWIIL